ncbi:peptide-methionine (S)-S-oxide reductase [Rhodobacteraceae bacterium WD3A24]|nr:peptide-methionine (S)-S-oxide reductase [Rhodobacteraceae bacterium WD3A24]
MPILGPRLKIVLLSALIVAGAASQDLASAQTTGGEPATAILAGGCFWCVEADFERVRGVSEAVSGFTGGSVENPGYDEVAGGGTGHREAVRITYDPDVVSYSQIVHLFFRSIDPLDAGGQFCDRGHQYSTAIYALTPRQREAAEAARAAAAAELGEDIVTPIEDAQPFYEAGGYHQDYHRSGDIVLTRFGPRSKASAYRLYRDSCGRDARVRELWGDDAPFADH